MDRDTRLPLFPLRTVLFPGGRLPLQIFEVRYLDMIGRAHREGIPFGVVCLTEGDEVRRNVDGGFQAESFHPFGTLARIDRLERPRPGLLNIQCTGLQRFRLERTECLPHGLWVGDAESLPDDPLVPIPSDLEHIRIALQRVVSDLRDQGLGDDDMPLQAPWRFDDCGWVANRWCDLLPLSNALRQQLLVVDSPLVRLELVADALDRYRQPEAD
ncbi:LON peptidase substrate-binding domain-containing protein [Rhizobacter sp. Root1221]|uniref:LON peptidase substrate-binding domain-containing protein n=1 Tax=Rhizobacter sp. Root1221 TaxID=1736433 RepID=UPI0006FB96A5|nr:LON peptidase substrate-binding domain-containing protein [Rhizobacter sp. Root1221]KQW03132.1 peptidase S16 [Rhizobacter sp. Root1221]